MGLAIKQIDMGITKEEKLRRDKLAEQGIKVCSKCKEEKPFNEFSKCKGNAYELNSGCRSCCKQYYQENRECFLDKKKQYWQENKEQLKKQMNQYQQKNKKRISEQKNQYYQENKERIKEWSKQYYQENKKLIKERAKQYRQENKERLKQYRQKREVRERQNNRRKERTKSDPMYRMRRRLSASLLSGFKQKGWKKDSSTQEVIGCVWEQLVLWIGGEPNDEFHIDHVIPQSLAETTEELKLLNHYTNFQLLPAEENISKGNRYIRNHNLKRVLAHHPQPDKLKEIVKRSNVEII